MTETGEDETDLPPWKSFQFQNHSLKIPVSNVAACVGFHPFKSLPQLAFEQVYQGSMGQDLLEHDAELLGIQLESDPDKLLLDIAQQAGKSTKEALKTALKVKTGEEELANVEQVKTLCQKVVQSAKESKKLTQHQIKQLEQGVSDTVNTGFGTYWENQALDQYEKSCGWKVRQRNEELRIWRFSKTNDGTSVIPMGPAFNFESIVEMFEKEKLDCNDEETNSAKESKPDCEQPKRKKSKRERSFFNLRGSIDGIRDELAPNPSSTTSPDDDDSWILRQVIVECKHRINTLKDSPPLYEMIQTIAYCQMYDVQEADVVQVLRRERPQLLKQQNKKARESQNTQDIKINRVSLKDPFFQHEANWNSIVLPRLRSWVEAIYSIRASDDKRYRLLSLLSSSATEKDASLFYQEQKDAWNLLFEECPWLVGCDTLYQREF